MTPPAPHPNAYVRSGCWRGRVGPWFHCAAKPFTRAGPLCQASASPLICLEEQAVQSNPDDAPVVNDGRNGACRKLCLYLAIWGNLVQ